MKVINQNTWLQPALDVIAQTAPKTYAEMQATDWNIRVITEGDDLIPVFHGLADEFGMYDAFGMTNELASEMDRAYGVTVGKTTDSESKNEDEIPKILRHATFINRYTLERGAKDLKVSLPKMVADTMVHEFTHRKGGNEDAAYDMGAKFADAMGEHKLADMQLQTGAEVAMDSIARKMVNEDW
jgi:hypothetical protein